MKKSNHFLLLRRLSVDWAVLLVLAGNAPMGLLSATGQPGSSENLWGLGRLPCSLLGIILQQLTQAFSHHEGRGIKEEAEALKSLLSFCMCVVYYCLIGQSESWHQAQRQCGKAPPKHLDRGKCEEQGRLIQSISQDRGQSLLGSNKKEGTQNKHKRLNHWYTHLTAISFEEWNLTKGRRIKKAKERVRERRKGIINFTAFNSTAHQDCPEGLLTHTLLGLAPDFLK